MRIPFINLTIPFTKQATPVSITTQAAPAPLALPPPEDELDLASMANNLGVFNKVNADQDYWEDVTNFVSQLKQKLIGLGYQEVHNTDLISRNNHNLLVVFEDYEDRKNTKSIELFLVGRIHTYIGPRNHRAPTLSIKFGNNSEQKFIQVESNHQCFNSTERLIDGKTFLPDGDMARIPYAWDDKMIVAQKVVEWLAKNASPEVQAQLNKRRPPRVVDDYDADLEMILNGNPTEAQALMIARRAGDEAKRISGGSSEPTPG